MVLPEGIGVHTNNMAGVVRGHGGTAEAALTRGAFAGDRGGLQKGSILKPRTQCSRRGTGASAEARLHTASPPAPKAPSFLTPAPMAPVLCASGVSRIAPAVSGLVLQGGTDSLVLCFGEMLIDFVPTENGVSLAEAPGFIPAPGGAPANVAVGVSRLGGRAAFVGKVGDEEFGRHLVDILEKNGVEVGGVRLDKVQTSCAVEAIKDRNSSRYLPSDGLPSALSWCLLAQPVPG